MAELSNHASGCPAPAAAELRLPDRGVGCWAIGGPAENLGMAMGWSGISDEQVAEGLRAAFDNGARLFDTADAYGLGHSEAQLGDFLRGVDRAEVLIADKVGYLHSVGEHGLDPRNIRHQFGESLKRLGTDYVDLYSFHHNNFGTGTEWLEPAAAQFRRLRESGAVRLIGMRGPHRFAAERTSEPRSDKVADFIRAFDIIRPDYVTVRHNLLTPIETGPAGSIVDYVTSRGAAVLTYKPLAQGLLLSARPRTYGAGDHRSRKAWFRSGNRARFAPFLEALGGRFGTKTPDRVALALGYCQTTVPTSTTLIGFTDAGQAELNTTVSARCLDEEDLDFIACEVEKLRQALPSYFSDSD
ncbi:MULTISPECIES: aldo/keto reductase [Nocardia]|uniref:aldo/keto reductase n=2 Tax=Nocardiaceae TaxID=85025 RepID=UPI000BEF1F14|nr:MULTISPECIES: aldo/keto reductase [Nocardia]MBF6187041.1 aldo/keto reductase [Nocardia farcinica]MBF6312688.1 aldo/keto reductase [Nocardia farcinica]MBF6408457.1 aldo/keto reductase [Nocardia farcinica]PEH78917.1 aldo/keto reductase [Nocardia sp. FDAARGOS_372]UEX23542.1 aldo/keto reductase [Nocardia farcinica]